MSKFRSICLFLAVAAAPGSAFAADLAPAPAEPVAPVAMPLSWTGFYVGANAGYGFGGDDRVGVWRNGVYDGDIGTASLKGFIGGAQVGYNYQIDNFVIGIETDFQGSALKDSRSGTAAGIAATGESKAKWYGTLRPRIGYAFGSTLVYATGGLAYGQIDYSLASNGISLHDSSTRVGWTAGAGVEQAINDHWSVKLEYQYVDFGGYRIQTPGNTLGTKPTPDFHSIRVGVNYKF